MVKPSKDTKVTETEIEIVSTRKTKTISKKSNLTYHIGIDSKAKQYIRIWVNSGNGYFSNEWVPLLSIIEILKQNSSEPAASIIFENLFTGKSVNTPSFLTAVLLDSGLLKLAEDAKRKFVYTCEELKIDDKKPRASVKKATRKTVVKQTA